MNSTATSAAAAGAVPAQEPSRAAASWPAIIAGAFGAVSVSLVLLALGSGLGFAAVSPWPRAGASGMTLAVTAAIWLLLTQWLSAGLGGYLAGRLRTRWIGTLQHEVFFRDTAHGFITWSVATVVVAALLGSGIVSSLGAVGHAATEATAQGAKAAAAGADTPANAYSIDRLFRPAEGPASSASPSKATDPKAEVTHIIANALSSGNFSDEDRTYLARLVSEQTGISQDDAKNRVNELTMRVMDAEAKAKAAADTARKAAARAAIYTALSMAVGAFIASICAALGGRLRDEHP